jgi:hypothetical protein
MKPVTLIRLYPRAWRERYGEEFLSTVGTQALHLQQIIDIVAGAIDAWLSPSVRRQLRAGKAGAPEGDAMTATLKTLCQTTSVRYTRRDAGIGAGIMLAGSLILAIIGIALKQRGYEIAGDVVVTNGFQASLMLSMPFWLLKGQPWRAQAVLIGGVLLLLAAATYIAYQI